MFVQAPGRYVRPVATARGWTAKSPSRAPAPPGRTRQAAPSWTARSWVRPSSPTRRFGL